MATATQTLVGLTERRVQALLARCASGDEQGMADLYDLTVPGMMQVACCVSASPSAAERAVHDAYLEIWARARAGRDFGPRPTLRLLGIAYRYAVGGADPSTARTPVRRQEGMTA